MKNSLLTLLFIYGITISGCKKEKTIQAITFATSAEYPPFEYHKNNEIRGFDIDLAKLISKELGKEPKFEDMQFSSILAALQNGTVDAAISTITITEERKKNFDFSEPYYEESLSMVHKNDTPIKDKNDMSSKRIACQLGTTMEIWLKNNGLKEKTVAMDNNNQAIEALKAGHVDGVLIDSVQAVAFASKNQGLTHSFIAKSTDGYGIAVRKNSKLRDQFNSALKTLQQNGELDKLKKKWLQSSEWNN